MSDQQLSPRERLVAALVEVEQGLPGGMQVALGIRLRRSIEDVERMFAEHNLPLRPQLVAELTLWRSHAEDGVRLMERGYDLLGTVIRSVDENRSAALSAEDAAAGRRPVRVVDLG